MFYLKLCIAVAVAASSLGCASSMSARRPASEWQNILTCDEGLRIDERSDSSLQLVLFGDAGAHFLKSGAFDKRDLNQNSEYVRYLNRDFKNRDSDSLMAILKNGFLSMPANVVPGTSSYVVQWNPYSNIRSEKTDFVFRRCH